MSKKFAFMGAGSFGFTRKLARDILSFPAFRDAELALMDVNPERLELIKRAVDNIVAAGNYPAKVTATTNRAEALEGADGVICTILSGGIDIWRKDIEIPKKYGVDTNVGDTRGPSGIFRFLRTAPAMMEICRDIEKYCPDAIFLNYTNPMAMLCRLMQKESDIIVSGLCHSVQGTAEMLAGWIGADMKDVEYTCAGINHTSFYLDFKVNGKDAYPQIRAAVDKPEIYNEEIVRNEMFIHLDYYVTESSGHNSEYNQWFRKRPDLIEKYCTHGTGWNPGVYGYIMDEYTKREDTWKDNVLKSFEEEVDLSCSNEYASYIFNAIFGDGTIIKFNGNVPNTGLIENLPYGCCVEVPVYASKAGLEPLYVGALPAHLATMVNVSARIEEMVVEAYQTGDKRKVFHAICMDPLTSAVLSLAEIKEMVDEMFEFNKDFLPGFR